MAQPRWVIERLGTKHDRSSFDSGKPPLSSWLKEQASQYEKRDLSRTYVAVNEGQTLVAGYYAIANHRVSYESLPSEQAKGLPRIDVPVILLGRLAVDRSVQGQGLGKLLLIDALRRAEHLAKAIGTRAVAVEAIDEEARNFYLKFGSIPLRDDENHLFFPMHAIRKLGLPPLS